MKILELDHIDFKLSVHTTEVVSAYQKSKRKQGDYIREAAMYSYTQRGTLSIELFDPENSIMVKVLGQQQHPIFFENKDYYFDVRFKHKVITPRIYSRLKEITERFYQPNEISVVGAINFGNDIGRSDLIIRYQINGRLEEFSFTFDVFPTKLDYQKDYRKIVKDIEQEYPLLVLDFLRKTYSNFHSGNTKSTDLIWWQVFGGLYQDFIKASRFILNKPHKRLLSESTYVKRDRIKRLTAALEEEVKQCEAQPHRYYQIEHKVLSADTPENQFFKYCMQQITSKFVKLKKYVQEKFKITEEFRNELNGIEKLLIQFTHHPFLKSIGEYRGIRQESLVLQKATGYSTIYRSWIMLNRGMSFFEGIQKIEMKNIAELYQIWCFLEMKKMLQNLLGQPPSNVKLATIEVDGFVFKFDTGKRSRVSFKDALGNDIELFHDYQFNVKSSEPVVSHTVSQRPDIVLQVTKNDLKDLYTFTYLYDAKYRLQSDEKEGAPDYPPEDAINQMHRYRDAIYYQNKSPGKPEKEVIGGYILFPGAGEIETIKRQTYFKSIAQVNIGAFPLRPNDFTNRSLLESHLKYVIGIDSESILHEVIPQKSLDYETINADVLIGIVSKPEHIEYFEGNPVLYHTGVIKPSRFGFGSLKYFAPYIKEKGVREYFEILEYRITQRNEIYEKGHLLYNPDDLSERLVLVLGSKRKIGNGSNITCSIRNYRYTKLSHLRNTKNNILEEMKER